jgi:hypothetical protein
VNILHNKLAVIDLGPLQTTQGVGDPMTSSTLNRVGDELNCKGVAFRMMFEMPVNQSQCTYRLMLNLVKSAKGDTPTITTLFNNLSTNKQIDSLNTERFTILFSKTIVMKANNQSLGTAIGSVHAQLQGTGGPATGVGYLDTAIAGNNTTSLGQAPRVVKVFIPGTRFYKSGVIRFASENGSTQTKFF